MDVVWAEEEKGENFKVQLCAFVNPLRFIGVSVHLMGMWSTLCQWLLVWWMTDIIIHYALYG